MKELEGIVFFIAVFGMFMYALFRGYDDEEDDEYEEPKSKKEEVTIVGYKGGNKNKYK